MRNLWRSGPVRGVLKVAVSGGVLWYLFTHIPLREITGVLEDIHLGHLLLGLLVLPVYQLVAAAQQKILTDHHEMALSVLELTEISIVASFYALFLPGYLAGGVIRWHRMSRPSNKPAEALAAIVFSRLLQTVLSVGLGVICWFVARPPVTSALLTLVLLGVLAALIALQGALFSASVTGWVRSGLEGRGGRLLPSWARAPLGKLLGAAGHYESLSSGAAAGLLFLGILHQFLGIAMFVYFARAVDVSISFAAVGWIHAFLTVALLVPISFAGLGVREGSLVVLLGVYGVAGPSALALSFVLLLRDLLRGAVGGLIEGWRFLFAKRQVAARSDRHPVPGVVHVALEVPERPRVGRLHVARRVPGADD